MNFSKKNNSLSQLFGKHRSTIKGTIGKITILLLLCAFSIKDVKAQSYSKKINATLLAPNGKFYFFTDKRYFKYDKHNGLEKIADTKPVWKGLPDNFDAAFVNTTNKSAYVFKGSTYNRWNFKKNALDNKQHPISKFWKGVPNNIDAATNHPHGRTYFFKDNIYYGYNYKLKIVDKTGIISADFKGIPSNLDAAFLHENGKIYFFKGNRFYLYNTKLVKVEKTGIIGKDGWRYLDLNKKNFTKRTVKTKKKGPGIDAALYNRTHEDVHFFRDRKGMLFVKQSGTRLVGEGNRIEVYGFKLKMKTYTVGASNWYIGMPQNIDAATPFFVNGRGTTHIFFKGNNVYFWSKTGVSKGFNIKQTISSNIPYNIDAAFENESDQLYLFKDDKYYIVDQLNQSHQRFNYKTSGKIKDKFPYAPINVDAARWDYETNYPIFYKENKYYTDRKVGNLPDKLIK